MFTFNNTKIKKNDSFYLLGLLLSLTGFFVFGFDIIVFKIGRGPYFPKINYLAFIFSIFVFILNNTKFRIYALIVFLSVTSIITFFYRISDSAAVLQLIVIFFIIKKGGFLQNKLRLKLIILISIISVLYLLRIILNSDDLLLLPPVILFHLFFYTSVFILFKDEIKNNINKEKKYKQNITRLNSQVKKLSLQLDSIKSDYIDPVSAGLTDAELELLRYLCLYKESNIELSVRLNKSVNTIKKQLSSILNKIGADDRHQLIHLCEKYYEA